MRLKIVEPDSCDNCSHLEVRTYPLDDRLDWIVIHYYCHKYKKIIRNLEIEDFITGSLNRTLVLNDIICKDGYEDDGSRIIK